MRILRIAALVALILSTAPVRAETDYLSEYRGAVKLPADLLEAYDHFVKAARRGDRQALEKFSDHRIPISDAPRTKDEEYGNDLNLPFLQGRFTPLILNLQKDSADRYLLRTGTSTLWFVRGPTGWRLERYFDKPIE